MAGSLKSSETKPFNLRSIRGAETEAAPGFQVNKAAVGRAAGQGSAGGAASLSTEEINSLAESIEEPRWEVRLGFGQMVIVWSVIAGTMIMVFLFGLYAGREQGVQSALDGNADVAARLPISNAVPPSTDDDSATEPVAGILKSLEQPSQKAAEIAPEAQLAREEAQLAALEKESTAAKSGIDPQTTSSLDAEIDDLLGDGTVTIAEKAGDKQPPEKPKQLESLKFEAKVEPKVEPKQESKPEIKEAKKVEPPAPQPEKAAQAAKSEPVKSVKAGSVQPGWYMQVAAARTSQEANVVAQKLQAGGLKPTIETAQVNGSNYFRVVLGPFPSKDAAAATRKSVQATNAAKGEPFLKQVR